jgi:hypothetical protein
MAKRTDLGGLQGVRLRSGMVLQIDVIAATGSAYHTTNIENGIALADEATRAELAARASGSGPRCAVPLGPTCSAIQLKLEMPSFSTLAGRRPPFWLSPAW